MTDVKLIIDSDTIRAGGIGPASGDIWIVLDATAFPMKGWNDFVVVILEAWASALVRLLRGATGPEEVHFMEGPYLLELVRTSEHTIQIRAIEGTSIEKARLETRLTALVTILLARSEDILNSCRQRGDRSSDVDKLDNALAALRNESKTLTN